MKKNLLSVFFSVFIIIGVLVSVSGIRTLVKAKASVHWPTASGKVSSAQIGTHTDSGSHGSGTTYSADVSYDYTIGAVNYSCSTVSFGQWSSSNSADARRILNNYPKNKDVTVHYNPTDPYDAVLEPGVTTGCWGTVGFAAIFALFGSAFLIIFLKYGAKKLTQASSSIGLIQEEVEQPTLVQPSEKTGGSGVKGRIG